MWTNRFTPKGELKPPPPGVGRMVVTGGAGVLALLGGIYFSMVYSKRRQEQAGTNPIYEQVLAHAGTKPMTSSLGADDAASLPSRSSQTRTSRPMEPPAQERDAKHDSIAERKEKSESNDYGEIRREQPAPQRQKGGGKDTLVSQSESGYMKGHGKDK